MKSTFLLYLIAFITINTYSQTEKKTDSKIISATVYQNGAEITRNAKVTLPKGRTVLLFPGLTSKIDTRSIQAKGDQDLTIVSVSHSIDYLNEVQNSDEIETLENKKRALSDSVTVLKGIKKVYEQEKDMILANKTIGGDNGYQVSELKNAAEFFRNRLIDIEKKNQNIQRRMFEMNKEYSEIIRQLTELNTKSGLPTSQLKVIVSAPRAQTYALSLTYITTEAGWEPNYDIRITTVDEPLRLFYKAKVFQNSGEDWKDVKLTLSTGNPSISNTKPELDPYYLTFNNYYRRTSAPETSIAIRGYNTNINSVQGTVTDAQGVALPGVNIVVKGTKTGTQTDFDGKYRIDVPTTSSTLVFTYIGFETVERPITSGLINVKLEENMSELDEVVVVGRKSSKLSRLLEGSAAGVRIHSKKELVPLAIEKRQTTTEFEIEIPYSIPSDNQQYDVTMVEYEVPADYHYSAVPKLSTDAYLTAKIKDWTQYEMVDGSAQLFYEGIYQGETFLDLKSLTDTLNISVGRDNDIVIEREIQKDYTRKSTIGTQTKETKAWKIIIKNNKDKAITIKVEDQFPISKINGIKVEQIESSGAKIDETEGKLTWDLTLTPKEKKQLLISYEVKYPKSERVLVD